MAQDVRGQPQPDQTAQTTPQELDSKEAMRKCKAQVWAAYAEVSQNSDLMRLFDRETVLPAGTSPSELLAENGYPSRVSIAELDMGSWQVRLDQRFVKDGYMFVLRGDNPGQGAKGFYSRTFGYARMNTAEVAAMIGSPERAGYVLRDQEADLEYAQAHALTVASELAWQQSAIGGSSFVSATTNIESAQAGTGNQPTQEEQEATELYLLKIPITAVINSNTDNFFGRDEREYLIPDCIYPDEVIDRFARNDTEAVYARMHELLGIRREDINLSTPSGN